MKDKDIEMRKYALPLKKFINSAALPSVGEFVARDYMLVFSPDDRDRWYWQRFSDWKTSQFFDDNIGAIEAMKLELKNPQIIKWE